VILHDVEQGTDEWKRLRLGKVTASRICDVLARTKSGWGASRAQYAAQLVCERLTGCIQDGFTNAAMQWGTATEPEARRAYEFFADRDVQQIGFIDHPTIDWSGCSPDGLVGTDGMVEIKCPTSATHIDTLLTGNFADKYVKQALWQLACTGRDWVDLASYDPRLPERMRLFVKRVERDRDGITEIETAVVEFLTEIERTVAQLIEQYETEKEAA
jgi:putative phage-type endonuclease